MPLPDPPGFQEPPQPVLVYAPNGNAKAQSPSSSTDQPQAADPLAKLKLKKAWELAWSPAKQIPMNALMLWMAGSGVQIFSIMITAMLFYQPAKAIVAVPQAFQSFETVQSTGGTKNKWQLMAPKLVYAALQLCVMIMGLWKCQQMGLLPTASSDWLAFLAPKQPLEMAL